MPVSCSLATSCAIRFQTASMVNGTRQIIATWVWSGVRVEPVALPSDLASLNAAAYSALARAGGGAGRNWEGLSIANGVTSGTFTAPARLKSGGVGCHCPGSAFGGVYAAGVPA